MADSTTVSFLLKSAVRSRHNRTARAAVPGRMPFVQRLAGGTIIVRRARPARISEAALIANIEEIKKAVSQHKIIVTTMSGQVLSLDTLHAAPAPADKLMPNPPLDSAKNDANENIGYDVPPTPEGTTMNAPEPDLLAGMRSPDQSAEEAAVEQSKEPSRDLTAAEEPKEATEQVEEAMALEQEPMPEEPSAPEAKPELMNPNRDRKSKGKRG